MDAVLHIDIIIFYLFIILLCITKVLSLHEHQTLNVCTKHSGEAPHCVHLGTRWQWVVSFTYRITLGEINPTIHWTGSCFECDGTDKNSCPPCQKSDLDCVSCRCSLYWLSYPSCSLLYYFGYKMIINVGSSLRYIHITVVNYYFHVFMVASPSICLIL